MSCYEPDLCHLTIVTDIEGIEAYLKEEGFINLKAVGYGDICEKEDESFKIKPKLILHDCGPDYDDDDCPVLRIFIVASKEQYELALKLSSFKFIIFTGGFTAPEDYCSSGVIIEDFSSVYKFIKMLYFFLNSRHLYPYCLADIVPTGIPTLKRIVSEVSFEKLLQTIKREVQPNQKSLYADVAQITSNIDQYVKSPDSDAFARPAEAVESEFQDYDLTVNTLTCFTKEIDEDMFIGLVFKTHG